MSRYRRWQRFGLAMAVACLGFAGGVLAYRLSDGPVSSPLAEADDARVLKCRQLATEFDAYPLVWLGEEFLGYELVTCTRSQTPIKFDLDGNVREPATDFFDFIYGKCVIPEGGDSCPVPLQVSVSPACGPRLDPDAREAQMQVRGVPVIVKSDSSLRIETQSFQVSIFAPGTSDAERRSNAMAAVESLVGANELAAGLARGDDLHTSLIPGKVC